MINTFLKACAEDKSWRLRYMMTEKIIDLAKILDKESFNNVLCEYFAKFLEDPEAEVRAISASKVSEFAAFMEPDAVLHKIVSGFKKLAVDSQVHVRSKLG